MKFDSDYLGLSILWSIFIVGFTGIFMIPVFASYIPVEVTVKARNCPQGSVLVINDVESSFRVDDRGKLTASFTGTASVPFTVSIHKFATNFPDWDKNDDGKAHDYDETQDIARMNLVVQLDCGRP